MGFPMCGIVRVGVGPSVSFMVNMHTEELWFNADSAQEKSIPRTAHWYAKYLHGGLFRLFVMAL